MTRKKKIFLILTILWLCFIFGHSLMPASTSRKESSALLLFVQQFFPFFSHKLLRKLAHFSIFAVWGGLLYGLLRQYERFCLLKPIGIALCGAFVDETIQLFVAGRSGQVSDMWIDLAGATCMILLAHLTATIIRKSRTP